MQLEKEGEKISLIPVLNLVKLKLCDHTPFHIRRVLSSPTETKLPASSGRAAMLLMKKTTNAVKTLRENTSTSVLRMYDIA